MIAMVPALIGQEPMAQWRNEIINVATRQGAISTVVRDKIAGLLFSNLNYQVPFMFMKLLNAGMLHLREASFSEV